MLFDVKKLSDSELEQKIAELRESAPRRILKGEVIKKKTNKNKLKLTRPQMIKMITELKQQQDKENKRS